MSEKWGYDVYLSDRVRELLDQGSLTEIFRLVEADLKDEWVQTPRMDSDTREQIYHELHALNRLEIKMKAIVDSLRRD